MFIIGLQVKKKEEALNQGSYYNYTITGCLPNIFSQFQGFQGFFLNFLAVFQGFLVKFLPVFKVLLKNFIRSLLTDSETLERI